MSNRRMGRFFSPKGALVAAGVFGVGCVLALIIVHGVVVENQIHIRLLVAALFFLAVGVILVPTLALRRGCKACGVKLEEHVGIYPAAAHDHVLAALSQPPGPHVAQLAAHRMARAAEHRTKLDLSYCPRCMKVGVARVSEELWKGQFYDARRSSGDLELVDEQLIVPLELVGLVPR